MRKVGFICLALLIALTILGASYAQWSKNVFMVTQVSTAPAPVLGSTSASVNVSGNSVTLIGTLSSLGTADSLTTSFMYGTSPGSLTQQVSSGTMYGTGTFNANILSLTPGTTYYYQSQVQGLYTVSSDIGSFVYNSPLAIQATLPSGQVGVSYSGNLAVSGGTSPYTWTIASGSLPNNLSLNSSTGAITGTPDTSGPSSFTVTVTDNALPTHNSLTSGTLSIIIKPAASVLDHIAIIPNSPSVATGGQVTFTAQGYDSGNNPISGPTYTWSCANATAGTIVSNTGVFTAGSTSGTYGNVITATSGSVTGYSSVTVTGGTGSHISIETSPYGSGIVVPSQNLTSGNAITVYAVSRDAGNNFVANVAVTWSLTNITGGVISGDLVPSSDTKSAVITGHVTGSATVHAASTSTADSGTITVTAAITRIYTGTGTNDNFSQADHWTGGSVPGAGENITILNTCNFDSANNFIYGTLILGSGSTSGTLQWPSGGNTNPLQVNNISAAVTGSIISMINGGTLLLSGGWNTANMTFTAGTGSVNYNSTAAQTVANLNYNNLTFSGARTTTSITINGAIGVAGTLTNTATFSSGNFVLAGSTFTFNGTGAQNVTSLNNVTYPTLTINKTSGIATLGSILTATTFNMTAGTFDASTYLLTATTPTFTAGTLRVGTTTWANNYSFAVTEPAAGTIEYYAAGAQTVNNVNTYGGNLTLSGSGTKTLGAAATTIGGNLTLSGSAIVTTVVGLGISGNLSIGDGTTFTAAGFALTVNGTTTVGSGTSGTLAISSATGAKLFTGLVTINSGGIWSNTSANSPVEFRGGINNSGTFNAGNGIYTFDTNAQALTGTITIPSVTVTTVTLTNNGTLTVGTALAGSGGLTNGAAGTLNIGGTSGITTLTATAAGNTVNYAGAAQTVKATIYVNLGLSGTGAKTTTGITVNGIFTVGGDNTVTVSAVPTYGAVATLQYNKTLAFTAGVEWPATFSGTGGVIIGGTGTITLNAAKIFSASVPLTINSNTSLNTNAANNYQLTFGGNFVNNGVFTANASPIVIANTMATQSIAGFTTTGTVSMTKTGGTATFTGNVNGGAFTLNGNGGTLNLDAGITGLTHAFTGTFTRTNGILNCSLSTLILNGTTSGSGGTFNAGSGTVTYGGTAAQTIANVNYYNLVFSGARAATNITINGAVGVAGALTNAASFSSGNFVLTGGTFTFNGTGAQTVISLNGVAYVNLTLSGTGVKTITGITVNGIFTMGGDATVTVSATPTYGAAATLQYSKTTPFTAGAEWPTTFNSTGGVIIGGTGTITTNAAMTLGTTVPLTINAGGALATGTTNTYTLTIGGTTSVSGTLTIANTGTQTFTGNVTVNNLGSIVETAAAMLTFNSNLTINTGGTFTEFGATTINVGTLAGTGGLTQTANATLNIGGASTITTLTATAVGNTVNYTGTGQTLKVTAYSNLTLSGGAETFGAITTVTGNLTLSGTPTATTAANLAVSGNLNIGDGTTLTAAGFTLTVTGTTTVGNGTSGTLTISSATGTKSFNGAVTINNSGKITETAAAQLSFGSDVTINGTLTEFGAATVGIAGSLANNGTYTASTGVHTFSGTTKTIGGTNAISIATATFTGTYTNSGTLTSATLLTVTSPGILTNNGTITATTALSGTGGLTQGTTGLLNIGGTSGITALDAVTNAGNTVNYSGTVAQTVKNVNYYNLGFSGARTNTSITINGAVGVAGALSNGASFSTGNFVLTSSTFTFNGTGVQTVISLNGVAYPAMTVNNSSGVTLGSNITVTSALTLTSGIITTGSNTLIAYTGTTNATVTRTSGYVYGKLQKYVATGSSTITFEIGTATANDYTPAKIVFTSVTAAGTLTVTSTSGKEPHNGTWPISSTAYVNVYWTLTNSTIAGGSYTVDLTWLNPDLIGGATAGSLYGAQYISSWSSKLTPSAINTNDTTLAGSGSGFTTNTGFGNFVLGN
jgi:hypothetical protein